MNLRDTKKVFVSHTNEAITTEYQNIENSQSMKGGSYGCSFIGC